MIYCKKRKKESIRKMLESAEEIPFRGKIWKIGQTGNVQCLFRKKKNGIRCEILFVKFSIRKIYER